MSKIRIHELAKQIDKSSKDIINILKDSNVEVLNHMSTLTDENVDLVKKAFTKTETKPVQSTESNVPEEKKSNISQVYHPQNSRAGVRPQGGQSQGQRPARGGQTQGQRPAQGGQTQGQRPAQGGQTQGQRPAQGGQTQGQRPQGGQTQGQRPQGGQTQGQRPQGGQTQGQRPQGGQTQGQRPQGGQTQGQRPQGGQTQGQRPQGGQTQGQRPQGGQTQGQRPQGGQTQGQRPQGGQTQGQRPAQGGQAQTGGNRPNSNRPNSKRPNQGRNNYRGNRNAQPQQQAAPVVKEEVVKTIALPEMLTIRDLAEAMKMPAAVLVKKLFLQGTMVTVNQDITYETAEEIALEFNFIVEPEVKIDVIEELLKEEEEDESKMVSRPPVICVMGHVDHGKTSLLDAIRKTHVTDKEAGGITQHIGAYVVSRGGQKITFLDTPGHEAFTSMRMRGANSTDIAILVVAADDGVMPQTVEAINHAKAAGIEIIVAVNKIDKPSANIERVKQELTEYELIAEDWGGSTIFVPVSAHTGEGIEQLLEMILLTAEMCELKANPKRTARGLVIEAELDKGKGPVATILVQKGTLRVGDPIAVGPCHGKVRAMVDDKGRRIKEAGPSTPVEILGLNDVPNAGEIFVVTENDKEARNFAETFISEGREKLLDDTKAKLSLDGLFSQIQAGNVKELGIIVKADVQGSVEAVKQSLVKLSNEEVIVKVIHGGVGAINESDVMLASASNAIIIGFNVRPDPMAKSFADREKVDLRLYKVIYNAIEDVESAMKGMLEPIFEEKVLGHAEIRQTFKASGIGTIAGSYVLDGLFQRGCSVRVTRDKELIFEGPLASLKRFKDDVKEVKAGYECGLVFEKFNDVKELDMVEAYTMVEVPR
ncbi:translation initiation factor IF-2 [Anaerobium acetethylicum]|uniref:Translation initiation factor IF-2 n=1 Tax=Anaerobium acetethylicum TaxID=1619234 RepID=A0A1D3TNG5_9FIRM|nr:translation initiation factor IF-2 [Anaerobium acetethylicum]SCP94880.1 translation initiation factor IF-2 [Anaerobium acetethylicum]